MIALIAFVAMVLYVIIRIKKENVSDQNDIEQEQPPQPEDTNRHFDVHNKEMYSTAMLVFLCFFAFAVGVTAASTTYLEPSVELDETSVHVYFYVIGDLIHPIAALVIYPVIIICMNLSEMRKHVRELLQT